MLDTLDTDLKLKIQYLFTVIVTIPIGIIVLIAPDLVAPNQDQVFFGVAGSVWLTFGILSALAIVRKEFMKFVPILLLQLIYKCIWITAVVFPAAFMGNITQPIHVVQIIVMAAFIVGDLLFIPFKDFFQA